jgi:hypothetical protein
MGQVPGDPRPDPPGRFAAYSRLASSVAVPIRIYLATHLRVVLISLTTKRILIGQKSMG